MVVARGVGLTPKLPEVVARGRSQHVGISIPARASERRSFATHGPLLADRGMSFILTVMREKERRSRASPVAPGASVEMGSFSIATD